MGRTAFLKKWTRRPFLASNTAESTEQICSRTCLGLPKHPRLGPVCSCLKTEKMIPSWMVQIDSNPLFAWKKWDWALNVMQQRARGLTSTWAAAVRNGPLSWGVIIFSSCFSCSLTPEFHWLHELNYPLFSDNLINLDLTFLASISTCRQWKILKKFRDPSQCINCQPLKHCALF